MNRECRCLGLWLELEVESLYGAVLRRRSSLRIGALDKEGRPQRNARTGLDMTVLRQWPCGSVASDYEFSGEPF
jgi:hypothetical protein